MSIPQQTCSGDAAADAAAASRFGELAEQLCEIGQSFHQRGWAPGTGGNYSIVRGREPLRLAITASGTEKSKMLPFQVLLVDEAGEVLEGMGRPSYESRIHIAVARSRAANAVFHTHSVWGTILSQRHAAEHGFGMEGLEMLKALEGVKSHEHREWVPILPNSQDIRPLAGAVEQLLERRPDVHGFLLQGHGLYTWGDSASQAFRHVEAFEFLFEVLGRTALGPVPGNILK
jgi:methylthioribulose-1-phosphate dehydratase